jgi:biotin-dependent carboxylase-like uncharacterized protein
MEAIKIIRPGILATIQDLGRYHYQQFGLSVSGAVDEFALRVGNLLAGNPQNTPALEFNYTGLAVEFLVDTCFAVTGGEFVPESSDGRTVACWQTAFAAKGMRLSFPKITGGCRGYLAVAGGFDVPKVMGSCSTYVRGKLGGFQGRPLKSGDVLKVNRFDRDRQAARQQPKRIPGELLEKYYPAWSQSPGPCPAGSVVRVIMGPQDDKFTGEAIATFLSAEYKITRDADRMGYRLDGPALEHISGADIISDGIPNGAIQVPGNGLPVILMADRQTTGGYPKIANIITVDLPRTAQMKPGDLIKFQKVTIREAHELLRQFEADISATGDGSRLSHSVVEFVE